MIADAEMIDRLWSLPGNAARFLRQSTSPRGVFITDVHTGVLDLLLRSTPRRGEAFVVFQLLSPHLPGSYDLRPDTVADVLDLLDRFEISDVECHRAFGPNWRAVVIHALEVSEQMDDTGSATFDLGADSHRRLGAWAHAREVAAASGRLDQWYRSQAAAWEPRFGNLAAPRPEDLITPEAVATIRDAAAALSVGDLVGSSFTPAHFETLIAPWRHATRHQLRLVP
ncbi:hypothetical protein [Gordonia rhizosphera]|uniref:Uncharacterized protein n=1 Tax=Gordonia rhizosphera NBRC 16068 TaxID=1108045 RepID=K6W1C8_9ACTN|nr:hypothetical protein [Gordonia rhizosphera]GAB92975.1 hypothetical protein GORHZ_200_00110 [Gordonia rhizosphera NBRC 16068]